EMAIADMQAKTAGNSGEVARKAAEIERLTRELRKAQVTVLRFQAHELMRRSITRTIVKLLVYLYERSQRTRRKLGALQLPSRSRIYPTSVNLKATELG